MEDTQKENEALIAEMLREAKPIALPSELQREPIIHKGDETLPAPMVLKETSSAGYVYVWDTRTYEKTPILYYMLAQKLRQRRPDGSYRFTTADPGKLPMRGAIKCMLHPEAENRKYYDSLGFRSCPKDNIPNMHQLEMHMIKRHSQEWAAIKGEKQEKEKAEDRALQRLLIAQQLGKLDEGNKMREAIDQGGEVYFCAQCKCNHRLPSRVWSKHLKYKVQK